MHAAGGARATRPGAGRPSCSMGTTTAIALCLLHAMPFLATASVNVDDFGAQHDGLHDDSDAIQKAIDSLPNGGLVLLPAGRYNISGSILVRHDYTILRGEGRATVLMTDGISVVPGSGANPGAVLAVVEFSASHGGLEDCAIQISGSASRIRNGLRVGPDLHVVSDEQDKSNYVMNNYNQFRNLYITGALNAIEMECGPSINGGDSGCWYNAFYTVLIEYSDRGIWLRGSRWLGRSGVNRNQFYSVRVGQAMNTGVQIDAGDTNQFFGCSFEGIDNPGRNNPPVAVVIAHHGQLENGTQTSGDNNNNHLFGTSFEAVKLAIINNNSYTHFFGQDITDIPSSSNPGGVIGDTPPIVYGLSSGGYGDWKCCSQLPHSCYETLPPACGGKS
eukprot:SAG31_NODE_6952_length_1837_cov_16.699655_1_plen_389_part_00